MIYLDTNILISAIDEKDPLHQRVLKLSDKYKNIQRVTSELTLVELASVYSRAGLKEPIIYAIATSKSLYVEIVEADFNKILKQAFEYSEKLRLKTLDLLHITIAIMINASYFATFDKDIIEKNRLD